MENNLPSIDKKQLSFESFGRLANKYGAKAVGLLIFPEHWRPNFYIIPTEVYDSWRINNSISEEILDNASQWITNSGCQEVLIRSSGASEKISDRGKYISLKLASPFSIETLNKAILDIFQHTQKTDPAERMGLVIQTYKKPSLLGHLSNEIRISPTRNQWKYEIENPWGPTKGFNSKFATMPDTNIEIICGKTPHQSLRSIGKWINENIIPKCHIEWLVSNGRLYLLQLDFEWPEHDEGLDPDQTLKIDINNTPEPEKASILKQYCIGHDTNWKKLKNLTEFDFEKQPTYPKIFQLPATTVLKAKDNTSCKKKLIAEIKTITANRAVVRTDCQNTEFRSFNLPRTDTVSAEVAVEWCIQEIEELSKEGAKAADLCFLVHAFLPAKSSAWAYAKPNHDIVIVDALWGLPDGMQVLPVDTYEVNITQNKVIQGKSTFKPRFVQENSDGTWTYQNILRKKGRSKVLTDKDILEIAHRTASISTKLNDDAQIMWFCGVPERYDVGKNVPWFRSREKFDTAPRIEQRYKTFKVHNKNDLNKLPDRQATISLAPDIDLIRDDDFLQDVINVALEKKLPVKLDGSILGHTYYRLSEAGVGVVLANAPKYYRKRDLRTFGKIVRDRIPINIQSGGENVLEAVLDSSDILAGLSGKMLEELEEFLTAKSPEDQTSELADIFEVLRALAYTQKISWSNIEEHADKKREKRGGFLERKVLLETSLPRPNGTQKSTKTVRIDQIGQLTTTAKKLKVPLTTLMDSIDKSPVHTPFPIEGYSLKMAIREGHLLIEVIEKETEKDPDSQPSLFDNLLL